MDVKRVQAERGSHIEPPLEQWWPDLKKLEWHAAVVAVDAGIRPPRVEVSNYSIRRGGVWCRQRGFFDVERCGPMSYSDAWSFLNGIYAGARIAQESPDVS